MPNRNIKLPIDVRAALTAATEIRSAELGFTVTEHQIVEAALRQYLAPEFTILKAKAEEEAEKDRAAKAARASEALGCRADDLEMSRRTATALENNRIYLVRDLVVKSEAELVKLKFGRRSLNEIKEILEDLGLSLGMVLPLATEGEEQ